LREKKVREVKGERKAGAPDFEFLKRREADEVVKRIEERFEGIKRVDLAEKETSESGFLDLPGMEILF